MKKLFSIKKIFAFVFGGLLPCAALAAVKTVTWTLPADWESQVSYGERNGRLAIGGPDFGYPSEPAGSPALPFLSVSIPVADGSTLSNCTVEAAWGEVGSRSDELGMKAGLRPQIVQEPHVVGEEPVETPEDPQYFGAARYPATPEAVGGVQTGAGQTTLQAWVTPYRWNGQTGKLEKATALKLTFTYDAPRAALRLSTAAAGNYTGLFLIVSPSQYKDMWGEYLAYRRSTHPQIEFEVVNTADIYSNAAYNGKDDAQRIHKYLEYRYKNRGNRTMYVILGGGCKKDSDKYDAATMIPLRMTATRNRLYYPSDLYYACMENPAKTGEVWDPNNDGIFLGYKNASGGYTSDTRAQVDIMPDIAVFRVPVRPSFTFEGKTVGAQAQINGLVAKLRRAEADDFAGRHNSGLAGLRVFADKYHGNTEDWMTQERTFYDGMVNVWSPAHADPVHDFEYFTRTAHRDWWFANRPLKNFYAATENSPTAIPNSDMEFYVIEAHGAPSGAGPLNNSLMWKSTHIQKVACWNLPCSTGKIDDDRLTVPEAMILNPDGGALVSYNNAREGYGIANNWDSLSALMERENRRAYLANGLANRTSGEAFIECHRTFLNAVGGLQISATGIACYIETMAFGDPLVKLSDVSDIADLPATIGGAFYREATTRNTSLTVNSKSSVDKLTVRDLNGATFVVSGQEFKAYRGMAVYGGNVKWTAPGGVGGAGIAFDAKRDLEIAATGATYFGPVFSNVGNVLVSGSNATLDFDKTGKVRDLTSLRFTGTGPNYIRSREGGIFPASFTIPVTDGTLVLQTQNVGGSGAASNTTRPLFALTNATLRIDTNPNWGTEFLNRPVWMNNATISSNYGKVGFGANVANPPGFDVWVFGDKGSVIGGNQDIEVNGEFRVHCENGARLAATVPFVKAAKTGSLTKLGTGTLTLSGASTIAGGVRVRAGKLVAAGVAGDVLGTGEVTVEDGATLELTKLPLTTITKLTVRRGAKLILPGAATTASYYLIDPTKGSVNLEAGSTVANVNAPDAALEGSMTGEGYYVDTSSFLNWAGADGNWSTSASDTPWTRKAGGSVAFANGDAVQFPDHGAKTVAVAVNGSLAPGYMNFNNHQTAYNFTKGGTTSEINVNSVYTVGETVVAPDLKVNKMGVTGGKTIAGNVVAPEVFVSPGAALGITGTLSSQAYITKVTLQVTQMKGYYADFSVIGMGAGWQFAGFALGELELFNADGRVLPPVGSTISASNGNSAKVTAVSGGKITVSGTAAMANLFNGTAGSASDRWGNIVSKNNDLKKKSATPTYTLTIEFASPVKMISKYRFGLADSYLRNPESWKLSVVEKTSGGTYTVSTKSGVSLGGTNCYTEYYPVNSLGDSVGAGTFSVAAGATLYLDGKMNVKPTVAAGATLAVTNKACMTLNKGWTLGGTVNLDVGEAAKTGWTKVLSGASLTAADVYKFALTTDKAVAKVQGGDLWVATEGIVEAPYVRQVGGACEWNTADWYANGAKFGKTFGEVITRADGALLIDVTNETAMTIGCGVTVGSIAVTNTTGGAASLHLQGGRTDVLAKLLDFSGFNGPVTWEPDLNGASVNAGSNRVTLAKGVGGTLNVASNGFVSTVGTFSTWNNAKESRIHFANSPRALNMGQMPTGGVLSFDGMTLSDGGGAFQKADITYRVEDGQSLTLTETGGYNARTQSSFDIRGGSVTVNPNGAWWFGQNGVTSYVQTNGAVTVNATGTTVASSGSGVVFGYTGEASFVFEMGISGGRFEVPNAILNVWNPTTITLSDGAFLKAKGAGARTGVAGVIEVGGGSVFEVGSAGLAAGSMRYNLYGGTLAAFEDAAISAPVELGSAGTLAAKAGAVMYFNGAVKADGATLDIGAADYTGAVRLTALPEGVTNYTVSAGTWDIGALRPTNAVLTKLDGTIAAELTDDELRQAARGGLKLIATTLPAEQVSGRVAVVTSAGTAVPATGGVSADGYLLLSVSYVEPLYATTDGATAWKSLPWADAIGMPFGGDWNAVNRAVVSNRAEDAVLAIPAEFTKSLTVVNAGTLTLTGETGVSTLDDAASTGETRVRCATANVTAGADTVIERVGSGTLTLGNGKRATMWNGVDWPTAKVAGFTGTAEIRYAGNANATALKYTSGQGVNGVVCYAETVNAGEVGFDYSLTRKFEDGLTLTAARLVLGNQNNSSQTFRQTGGKIVVTGTGDLKAAEPTKVAPLLFSHWNNPVAYYLTGGELIATNGVNGSVYFGRDGVPKLYVGTAERSETAEGRGAATATLRTNGLINDSRDTKDKQGSVLELLPNGRLEVGRHGFALYRNAELRMSGGTFLAYESAAMSSAKFTLTTGTTSVLAAANGKSLTVNTVPTGTGALVCGDGENGGTVILKGGSWENVTLGGTFEIWLTAVQEAATKNVNLFTPAAGGAAANVTVRSSTGGEPDGVVCEYGGKITFVPSAAYRMPIVGEVCTNDTPWHLIGWHDSSATPKAVAPLDLPNYSDVVLEVRSNATVSCDMTQTLPSLRIVGPGAVDFVKNGSSTLTISSAQIATDVTATGSAVKFTLADIAEGATLAPTGGEYVGNVTGGGTVECHGFCPTYGNLADATKWTGTAKYVVNNAAHNDLDFSRMGNGSSAVELAGMMTGGYPKNTDAAVGKLVVSGAVTFSNGYSANVYSFGALAGSGSLAHNSTQTYKLKFSTAEDFAGSLSTKGMQIGIGANAALAAKTIAVAAKARIAAGKTWTADNGISVQSGGELGVAFRADGSAASSSAVTVAQGGFLNFIQNAPTELTYKVTSGPLNLNGGVKVNGVALGSDEFTRNGGTITLKAGTLTWNGGAEGVWDTTTNCWRTASGADAAWHDGFAGGNAARFANVAAVTLAAPVAPALIDLAVPAATRAHEGYVPTAATVVFENVNLADVAAVAGDMYGNYISSKGAATPCFVTRTAGQIGVQFQKRDNELKCVKVVLTQDGANVKAQAVWAAYANGAEPGTTNFENASHNGTVVTSDDGKGYGIKNLTLTMAGHGELTVRAAQNFAAPVAVTNGTLRLTAGEMAQDLALGAGTRLDLVAEAYAVTNVITSGTLTGATLGNVTVNGAALSADEWTLDGNRLIRDTSAWITVRGGETVRMPDGLGGKTAQVFVETAGGTLAADRVTRLNAMNVIGGGLTLKVTGDGMLFATNGLYADAVTLDASGLDGTALAGNAVCGVPYSRWLVRGEPLPEFAEVRLPEMPKHYSVTNETVAGVGVRLVVTAPATAKFGAFGVNVHNGTALDQTAAESGLYPLAHALWGNVKAEANQSAQVSNVTFAVGGSASGWGAGNAADALQKQYMDDNGGCERTIALTGLGAVGAYRIVVYFSTDSGNIKFCPMRVNGVWHSGPAGATVADFRQDWGDTGPQGGARAIGEGVNALATDVLTADEVVLGFERVNAGVARATPCAVQVVQVGQIAVPGKDFTATLDGYEFWEGVRFSEIAWDGEPYEPGPNNTVTLTVDGDVYLETDVALELQAFRVVGGADGGYLWFDDADGMTVGAATAKVAAFDFGGATDVFSPFDFGTRIVALPSGYFTLTAPHDGPWQDGYSYQGDGNAFAGSGFAGTKVSVSADSTLAGEFDVTGGGLAVFGYGSVTSAAGTFLGATKGTVEVGAWASVTVPHLRFLNSEDAANHAVLNVYGELNVDSVSTQWSVWAERNAHKGILFGHWHGTGEYNVGIDPYDATRRGRLVGEAAYLQLVYTAERQTLNVTGGTVRVRGISANNANGVVTLSDGGRLELAEGFFGQAVAQRYGEGTVSAYSYGGSTGWTTAQAVAFENTTLDANGLALGFTGEIASAGYLVIDDTSAGGGGKVTLGAGISGQEAVVYVDGGTLELAAGTTLNYLEVAAGAKIDLAAVPTDETEVVLVRTTDGIAGTPEPGKNLKAAGWKLKVGADGKTLKAFKPGTVFLIVRGGKSSGSRMA